MEEPNFRKEWIDGKWVPDPVDPSISWRFDKEKFKYPLTPPPYDGPGWMDCEEMERIERGIVPTPYSPRPPGMTPAPSLKEEAEYVERILREKYYPGTSFSGLDSFGIALDLAKKSADAEKEKEMATREKVSPFKRGRAEGGGSRGGSQFLRLKDGESVVFAPMVGLDEMISADMHEFWDIKPAIYHPCIGRNCPGCEVGNEPRFKGYLPVLVKSTGDVQIYPFTISIYNQLEALEDEITESDGSNLKGFVVKVSRKGSGMATRYTVLGVGSRIDLSGSEVPDFVPQLGPQTEDDIWELLENNGFNREDGTKPAETKPAETSTDPKWGDV